MFFFSKPFIGDLDYKIIRDCCKIWDEYWMLRKNSFENLNALEMPGIRSGGCVTDLPIGWSDLNSSIFLCPCGFCGNRSLYRGVRSVSDCQICWFLFDQSWLRRLKVMLLSCVNHTDTAVRLHVYSVFVKSIEQELKIQWEYRSHRNFDFKRPYLGNEKW